MTSTDAVEVLTPELVPAVVPSYEVVLTDRDLDMIRRQITVPTGMRPPNDVEVDDFGRYCMAQRLNPFDAHIYLMPIRGQWRPFTSVHGRLVIAWRTGEVTGMEGPFYCHERTDQQRARGERPDWDELWDEDDPPRAAKFVVHRRGLAETPVGVAPWRYYAYEDDGKGGKRAKKGLWQSNPPLILGYKAITRALGLVFRDVMPPAAERDEDVDVDDSAGYVRDDGAAEPEGPPPPVPPVRPPPESEVRVDLVDCREVPAMYQMTGSRLIVELRRLADELGYPPPTTLGAVAVGLFHAWQGRHADDQPDEEPF
jgi:hypothetical protein